jgi:hypothetical protein
MTERERKMLIVVGGMGAVFLGVVVWYGAQGVSEGFAEQDAQIASLTRDVKISQQKLRDLDTAQAKLNRWREISLPPDSAVASNRYEAFLKELTRHHYLNNVKITPGGMRSAATRTTAQVTPLSFSVTADATLPRVVGFLKDFYGVNLPHAIREMHLAPLPGSDGRLDVQLRIEALTMPTAASRDYLVAVPDGKLIVLDAITALKHGPVGFALAPWLIGPTGLAGSHKLASLQNEERDYDRLVDKNVFMGLISRLAAGPDAGSPDREILKVVELTAITENFLATEAWLRNRLTNKTTFIRAEGGRDTFEIKDTHDRVVLKGKVKHIEHRSVIFEANERFYVIKIGQFMDKALQKELDEADLKALGVSTATATGNP